MLPQLKMVKTKNVTECDERIETQYNLRIQTKVRMRNTQSLQRRNQWWNGIILSGLPMLSLDMLSFFGLHLML